jgi:hypothetical protein
MQLLISLIIGLLAFLSSRSAITPSLAPVNFSGEWQWTSYATDATTNQKLNPEISSTFSLTISQTGNTISGNHCANINNASLVDCYMLESQQSPSFSGTISNNTALVTFTSYRTNTSDQALLTLANNQLQWRIIKTPPTDGYDFVIPNEATLTKQTTLSLCEQALRTNAISKNPQNISNRYKINNQTNLLVYQCALGAYQPTSLLYLQKNNSYQLLKLTHYINGTFETSEEITGLIDFENQSKTLSIYTKSAGHGGCGSAAHYRFTNNNFLLTQLYAYEDCDHPQNNNWPEISLN